MNNSIFSKPYYIDFMLEWKVFQNNEWIESNTIRRKTLKEINYFMDIKNINSNNNSYTIKGCRINNSSLKWETLVCTNYTNKNINTINENLLLLQ